MAHRVAQGSIVAGLNMLLLCLPIACRFGDGDPAALGSVEQHDSFYSCGNGADFCGAPVTGVPDQMICGADGARYQCQPDGWHWRGDLGACTQTCDGETSFRCPDLVWSNACGEPQAGVQQQLACNPYNDVYQCVRDAGDAPGTGHWELRGIGDCLASLGITCALPPTSFYSCPSGADFCHAPVTGVPLQIGCGTDGARYQCQPDGWRLRSDLGSCTQTCASTGLFTCGESPGLCWEPQTGVQQELNCTPFNDVMQCVQGPDDPVDQGHWEVKWLGGCDAITGRRCAGASACVDPTIVNPSFEDPRISPPYQRFTNLPGWTGIVDIHDHTDLAVADGLQVVDLNQFGRVDQPLAQPVTLVPGEQYELRFSHAVNVYCNSEARFSVRVGGVYRTYRSDATMREEHLFFIAREAASAIEFTSLTDGCGAATIDDVHLTCSTAPREWPNPESSANSDGWLTQHHDAISVMRPRIAVINYANLFDAGPLVRDAITGLDQGSRYHGYSDPLAPAFLDVQVAHMTQLHDTDLFARSRWATQQGGFAPGQHWLAGDFDGEHDDGTASGDDVAIVFGDAGQASIEVYRSNRTDAFAPADRWVTRDGGFGDHQRWLAADFTGDGRADIVSVFDDGGQASIDVYRSTGSSFGRARWATQDGEFSDQQTWLAGDVDHDGKADLIKVFDDGGQASIDVYLSTGSGFTRARWATQQGGFWVGQHWLAGDVNHDEYVDVVNVFDDGGLASIDVHTSNGSSFAGWGRWSTRDGEFSDAQKWLIGDFNNDGRADLATVFGEPDAGTGASLISVDVRTSTGIGFARSRWETRSGTFWDAQQWLVADVNSGGFRDLVNVFDDDGWASMDVHLMRANHESVPRDPGDPTKWDYAAMFTNAYADVIGIADASGRNLSLCELIASGAVHEVWVYVDPRDNTTPAGLEVVESKQVYDVDGAAIPGRFEPCAGNGCLTGAAAAAAACGRTVKIVIADATRGPGCVIHSEGHGFEKLGGYHDGGAAQPIVPPLSADFVHFANFDLDTRFGLPAPTWYQICYNSSVDFSHLDCGDDALQSCVDFDPAANNALHWRQWGGDPFAVQHEGDITAYDQGCGSVHFPPNARDDYDETSCQPMRSTCESFGARNGPGGIDQPVPYVGASHMYDTSDASHGDCEYGWQLYWRQSFPGRENRAVNQRGIPIPNWWPFLYY